MSSPRSQVLSLPYLRPSQAQKHVTHNDALRLLDILVQLVVSSRTTSAPPSDPPEGRRHIVPQGATGAWSGAAGMLAVFQDGEWIFITPLVGWQAYVKDENIHVTFEAGSWAAVAPPSDIQSVTQLGVNTSADATNRLAVSSANTLLTHAGSDHRLKINKAGSGDTASLLFQNAFTGHAELGAIGSNRFDIRVSSDGSTWNTALSIDDVSGVATFPQGLVVNGAITGEAVVGMVSQSDGTPTGAIVQRGSNVNGEYTRFADGTQICWIQSFSTLSNAAATWTFPAEFISVSGTSCQVTNLQAHLRHFSVTTVSTVGANIRSWDHSGSEDVTPGCRLFAHGRWF